MQKNIIINHAAYTIAPIKVVTITKNRKTVNSTAKKAIIKSATIRNTNYGTIATKNIVMEINIAGIIIQEVIIIGAIV